MLDIKKYCEYLNNSLYIPIYLYHNQNLTACYPVQEKDTHPPSRYLEDLFKADKKISYTMTLNYSYYGCIKIKNSNSCIVIGPINDFPYNKETLLAMSREYTVAGFNPETFDSFFHNIPTQNLEAFISTLLFINYSVNHIPLTKKDMAHYEDSLFATSINQQYTKNAYTTKEESTLNNNYAIESELLRYIETGNMKGLFSFTERAKNTKVGIIANDNLRQLKNTFVTAVAIISRAAMRGGLDPSIAYPLSDMYLQQMERLTDPDVIQNLMFQLQHDYTNRVANSIAPTTADNILYQVIQYVRANTNKEITVTDIAKHVGFSRPYLSRKVKKELGFNLSDFIKRCKLEDAKDLLAFSDKSISQISTYLCFSSQSHFQKAFKDKYGITPQTFRKSVLLK